MSVWNILDIMTKKSEGRPITPEEYQSLVKFVELVERRVEERSQAEQEELEARIAEARALIPEVAFSTPLEFLELPGSIYNILAEAKISMAGNLMLTMNLDPEKIRSLSGIGPKAMETIQTVIESAVFPEPEPEPEPEAEAEETDQVEGEQPAAEGDESPAVEGVEAKAEGEPAEDGSVEGRPLDEIFSLRPDMVTPAVTVPEEEVAAEPKKKKKKKKKHIKVEYDPDLDEVIITRKRKRDTDDYGEDW